MNASQIFIIIWFSTILLYQAHLHGKVTEEKHNFWCSLFSVAIIVIPLITGGFFK